MQKIIKKQEGISLVALIITIIVMVILAGIIITAAVADGGIIDRAKISMREKEEAEIEEIVQASIVIKKFASSSTLAYLDLDKTGIAIFENLTANGFTVLGAEDAEDENGNPTKTVQKTEAGDGLKVNVQGDHVIYEGTVTEKGEIEDKKVTPIGSIPPGPTPPVENDFEIEVGKGFNGNSYMLYINPIIPDDWAPTYTKKEAVNIIAGMLKGEGIIASDKEYEDVLYFAIDLYNFANDMADSPFKLDPTDISTPEELKQKLSPYFDNKIPTDSQIEEFILTSFFQVPFTTMEEFAQSMYEYEAESRKLTVNGVEIEEKENWGANSAEYLVEKNGTYEIKLELDGKIATKTVEVNELEKFQMYTRTTFDKYYSLSYIDNPYSGRNVNTSELLIVELNAIWYNPDALKNAKTKIITINDKDITDKMDWETNTLNYVIDKNGKYEVKVQIDDDIKTHKFEITDLYERLNAYVKYDSNQDGNLEDEIMYRVLYIEGELGEGAGAQIVSENVIAGTEVELGHRYEDVDESELKEIYEEGNLDFERALYSYNNSTNILNNKCKEVIKEVKGITNGVRSIDSDPRNPYEDLDEVDDFKVKDINGYVVGTDTWFDKFDGIGKIGEDDRYGTYEYYRLRDLGIATATGDYWLASRLVDDRYLRNNGLYFSIMYGHADGGHYANPAEDVISFWSWRCFIC